MLQSSIILIPQVSHAHYFNDGAPSKYNNFKNLTNLIHHQDDHQLSAKWIFFATSYGKSPCDGIGSAKRLVTHRLAKRLISQSSCQNNHILNVDLMHDWCVNNIPRVIFIKINTDKNFLWKKDIPLLMVFKAQEFIIVLFLLLMALKSGSFLMIRVHQMSPFQRSKHLLILLTLCQECMLLVFMMMTGLLEML